jgi:hypothetical protein
MKVDQIVRAAGAEVITITTLRPGDVYSRLEKQSYSETYYLRLGIVQSVHSNGEDAAFTAVEIDSLNYEVSLKVYGTGANLALFAATPEEIRNVLSEALTRANRGVKDAEESLSTARDKRAAVDRLIDGAAAIQSPETAIFRGLDS